MTQDSTPKNKLMTQRLAIHAGESVGPTRRSFRSAPRLSKFMPKLVAASYKKYGFAEQHILTYWRDIVGPHLAKSTAPEKLSRPGKDAGGTLTVRVSGAAGLELQHLEPQILERINGYYGRHAVAKLRLVRGPRHLSAKPRKTAPLPLTAHQKETVKSQVAPIENEALRATLERLGGAVLRERAKRP